MVYVPIDLVLGRIVDDSPIDQFCFPHLPSACPSLLELKKLLLRLLLPLVALRVHVLSSIVAVVDIGYQLTIRSPDLVGPIINVAELLSVHSFLQHTHYFLCFRGLVLL